MATTVTGNNNLSDLEQKTNKLQNMVGRLYALKNRFESNYYNGRGWKKYDRAREFTIRINMALYHAHKMMRKIDLFEPNFPLSNKAKTSMYVLNFNQISGRAYTELEEELDSLGRELNELIQ